MAILHSFDEESLYRDKGSANGVRQLSWGHQTSHLPIELCEMIIDCIAAGVDDSLRTLKTLAACARVCRAWLHRAQYCLSSDFTCRNATLQRWPNVAIRRPFLLRGYVPPLAHFLIATSHIPCTQQLVLRELNLSTEHSSLLRSVRAVTVQSLWLIQCKTHSVAQLGRLITSFPSLSELYITWSVPQSRLLDGNIRRDRSRSCLKELEIDLIPNTSALLDYFIKARPFVTQLRKLVIRWNYVENREAYFLLLRGVKALLLHCKWFLEELWIIMQNQWTRIALDNFGDFIPLYSLVNLQVLRYVCYSTHGPIARCALQTLRTVPSINKVTDITISLAGSFGEEAGSLDTLLTSEKFESLHTFSVREEKQIASFPKLKAHGVQIDSTF